MTKKMRFLLMILAPVVLASCHLTGWSLFGADVDEDGDIEGWPTSNDGTILGAAVHFAPNQLVGVGNVPDRRPDPPPLAVHSEPVIGPPAQLMIDEPMPATRCGSGCVTDDDQWQVVFAQLDDIEGKANAARADTMVMRAHLDMMQGIEERLTALHAEPEPDGRWRLEGPWGKAELEHGVAIALLGMMGVGSLGGGVVWHRRRQRRNEESVDAV